MGEGWEGVMKGKYSGAGRGKKGRGGGGRWGGYMGSTYMHDGGRDVGFLGTVTVAIVACMHGDEDWRHGGKRGAGVVMLRERAVPADVELLFRTWAETKEGRSTRHSSCLPWKRGGGCGIWADRSWIPTSARALASVEETLMVGRCSVWLNKSEAVVPSCFVKRC